jgi:hypothetical protein
MSRFVKGFLRRSKLRLSGGDKALPPIQDTAGQPPAEQGERATHEAIDGVVRCRA